MGSSNTGATVLDRLIGDAELTEIMANHLRLDLHLVEGLAVVNTNNASDHLGDDDHVTKMGLYTFWLLKSGCLFLGFTESLNEGKGFPLESARELPAGTAVEELCQLLTGHVQKLIQIHTTVGVFTEGSPLLLLSGFNCVLVSLKFRKSYVEMRIML